MLKHRYIKKLSGLLFASLLVFGCTDLETEFTDSLPAEPGSGGEANDPAALLITNYNRLGDHINQDGIMALLEHPSDEMIGPTRGTDWGDNGIWRSLHQHTWDPTHAYVLAAWNNLNAAVFLSNIVLASNPNPQQAAEAKFLRAYNMWYVMDLFGVVPFREVGEGVDVDPKVLSRPEAFDFIVKDLNEAIPNLPAGGPEGDPGRASKAAAWTLLAKLYLNKAVYTSENAAGPYSFSQEDMNKVIEYADLVTAQGYDLEEEYFDNFIGVPSSEIIFIVDKAAERTNRVPDNYYFMGAHYNQEPGGWNGFTTLSDFYNMFDEGDVRLGEPDYGQGFAVGPQVDSEGNPVLNRRGTQLTFRPEVAIAGNDDEAGIRVFKYHPGPGFGSLVLFRYADVYLMKIEAILRGGNATGESAQAMLDRLRALRGVGSIPATLENVLDERGRELYYERVRRTDQIRFETFTGAWQEKAASDPTRVLFPVPQQALDSNPNLEQNPGY